MNDMEDLDGHVKKGGDVENALLLLLLQVVQDDAGHPHLVQQPRVDVPKIEAAMQQANTLEGEKDNNERGRPVQWSMPVSATVCLIKDSCIQILTFSIRLPKQFYWF